MARKEITQTLILAWPLLLGLGMIMTGNGLQGTLLGLRAGIEGFSIFTTGTLMSLYFVGYLAGCYIAPRLIAGVGHIRVFAALASLASTTILCNGLFIEPAVWGTMRFLSGLSFATLFIVSESWLNDIAPSKLRAKIFGAYMMVINGGLFTGQFLIGLAPITNMMLFVLVSVLISLAMMPLTLANKPSPNYTQPEKLPFKDLVGLSQLATLGVFVAGFAGATIITLGPAYMQILGADNLHAASLTASYILGCAILPLILGGLSDRFDRRKFITALALLAFALGLWLCFLGTPPFWLSFLLGGTIASIYSVSVAYMNDRLSSGQMIAASASLILINGIGAIIGPILVSASMQWGTPSLFFPVMTASFLLLTVLGVMRMLIGPKVIIEDQGEFVPLPARSGLNVLEITED